MFLAKISANNASFSLHPLSSLKPNGLKREEDEVLD